MQIIWLSGLSPVCRHAKVETGDQTLLEVGNPSIRDRNLRAQQASHTGPGEMFFS